MAGCVLLAANFAVWPATLLCGHPLCSCAPLVYSSQMLNNAAAPWELDRRIRMQEGHQLGEWPASIGALHNNLQLCVIHHAACAQPRPR